MTIIDPTHPLYGRTFPLLRMPSPRSKARLLVELPDGRVQRLPREVTDLDAAVLATRPQALISVPTLLPLAHLICAMLVGKEDVHDDTTHALTTHGVPKSLTGTLCESPRPTDLVVPPGPNRSAATGPLPLRPDPADAERPGHGPEGDPR